VATIHVKNWQGYKMVNKEQANLWLETNKKFFSIFNRKEVGSELEKLTEEQFQSVTTSLKLTSPVKMFFLCCIPLVGFLGIPFFMIGRAFTGILCIVFGISWIVGWIQTQIFDFEIPLLIILIILDGIAWGVFAIRGQTKSYNYKQLKKNIKKIQKVQ